jgi:cytochrome P450
MRSCAGRAFALMELKVLIVGFLTHKQWTADEKQLTNPNAIYDMSSEQSLEVTFK